MTLRVIILYIVWVYDLALALPATHIIYNAYFEGMLVTLEYYPTHLEYIVHPHMDY